MNTKPLNICLELRTSPSEPWTYLADNRKTVDRQPIPATLMHRILRNIENAHDSYAIPDSEETRFWFPEDACGPVNQRFGLANVHVSRQVTMPAGLNKTDPDGYDVGSLSMPDIKFMVRELREFRPGVDLSAVFGIDVEDFLNAIEHQASPFSVRAVYWE